jgi:hypothetical protein
MIDQGMMTTWSRVSDGKICYYVDELWQIWSPQLDVESREANGFDGKQDMLQLLSAFAIMSMCGIYHDGVILLLGYR